VGTFDKQPWGDSLSGIIVAAFALRVAAVLLAVLAALVTSLLSVFVFAASGGGLLASRWAARSAVRAHRLREDQR